MVMFHSYVNLPEGMYLFFLLPKMPVPLRLFQTSNRCIRGFAQRSRFRRRAMKSSVTLGDLPHHAMYRSSPRPWSLHFGVHQLHPTRRCPWNLLALISNPTKYHLGTPQTQFRTPKNPWFLVELDSPKHPKQPRFYWLCQKAKLHHVARKRLQWGHWNIYWNKNNPMLEYDHVD